MQAGAQVPATCTSPEPSSQSAPCPSDLAGLLRLREWGNSVEIGPRVRALFFVCNGEPPARGPFTPVDAGVRTVQRPGHRVRYAMHENRTTRAQESTAR